MKERIGWIYGLFDIEEPNRIRYGGKTLSRRGVADRVYHHLWGARKLNRPIPSAHWIRKIGKDRVGYVILEETTADLIDEAEIRWIAELRSRGMADLNVTDGGDGQTSEQVSGEKNPRAKLTWDTIRSIRETATTNYVSTSQIARTYELTPASVSKILRNANWYDPQYNPNTRLTVSDTNQSAEEEELVWRTLTDTKVEELRELYLSGVSVSEIVTLTGKPSTSVHRALFHKYGSEESRLACIAKRGSARKMTKNTPDEVKAAIVQRYRAGESQASLSRELGVSQPTISLWVHHDRLK